MTPQSRALSQRDRDRATMTREEYCRRYGWEHWSGRSEVPDDDNVGPTGVRARFWLWQFSGGPSCPSPADEEPRDHGEDVGLADSRWLVGPASAVGP